MALEPPAWSPAAFVGPVVSGQQNVSPEAAVPVNKLRNSKPEAASDGPVLRWKMVAAEDKSKPMANSYSQALTTPVRDAGAVASSQVVRQPMAPSQSVSMEPRTTFKLNPPQGTITIGDRVAADRVAAEDQGVSLASHRSTVVEPSRSNASATNGVWYDRKNVAGGSTPNNKTSNPIQRTRYQEPADVMPEITPPSILLPPATSGDRPSILEQNDAPELVPQQEVPSPFPKPKSQDLQLEDSPSDLSSDMPSDAIEPPPMNLRADQDPAPKPPRRSIRSSVDCDSIRQLAKEQQDISKIRIDSSPNFVEGYRGKNQKVQNTKQGFLNSAEMRTWYDYDGMVIAEGKLAEVERGMAIIQREDGSRVSSLLRKLSDADNAYISQAWGVPVTCSIEDRSFPSRDFLETTMTFKASGACNKPLYFEEVQLERYGHEWGPVAQPFLSTAHFFGNAAVLPYKMGIHPVNECQYALGYYRPGSCAPWTVGPVPISLRGALMQAKVVTGLGLAIP